MDDQPKAQRQGTQWRARTGRSSRALCRRRGAPRRASRPEPPSPTRTEFQRDRDRIVHSTAFRRLAHKTQVFVHHEGDHFRTRLTHTIEVAQLARALARAFAARRRSCRGGRARPRSRPHAVRPYRRGRARRLHGGVRRLRPQQPRPAHRHRTRAPLRRFRRPQSDLGDARGPRQAQRPAARRDRAPAAALRARAACPRRSSPTTARRSICSLPAPALEAQAAALADDIAYNAHDIDDGLRAGLFDLPRSRAVPFVGRLVGEIERLHPGLEERARVVHELIAPRHHPLRRGRDRARRRRARRRRGREPRGGRGAPGGRCSRFSAAMAAADRDIKAFLFARMYRHPRSQPRCARRPTRIVRDLFAAYLERPAGCRPIWAAQARRRRARRGRSPTISPA